VEGSFKHRRLALVLVNYMNIVKIGRDGLEFSRAGLGSWAFGGGGWRYSWGPQDDKLSAATIGRAMELGVNWIDTAPLYGFGHSEEVIGGVVKDLSVKPFIATKCGLLWDEKRRIDKKLTSASIRREAEESLRRLRVEAIDLYQIHWPLPESAIEEGWSALLGLKAEGKIKNAGVCNFSVDQLKRVIPLGLPVSIQLPYNYLEREIESELLHFCKKNGIAVLAYGVLKKGFLSGCMTKDRVLGLPMDDHRKRDDFFCDKNIDDCAPRLRDFIAEARSAGQTPAAYALTWALKNENISCAIVGARSPQQLSENLAGV